MAIDHRLARLILGEHRHRPIEGTVLLFGRQTVVLTAEDARALLAEEGMTVRVDWIPELDDRTYGSSGRRLITDRSFFAMFCDAKVTALDVSDYEGAEIVADLNQPVDRNLWGYADFAFNGSCLDNLFDAATALKNMSRMLKAGGRIVHIEHGSPVQGAYVMYSPAFFFDYYAVNEFADCKVYAGMFDAVLDPWHMFQWEPYYKSGSEWRLSGHIHPGWRHLVSLVVAEKGETSTSDRTPIQGFYRAAQGTDDDLALSAMLRFRASGRTPLSFARRSETLESSPVSEGGFLYRGVLEDPILKRQAEALRHIEAARREVERGRYEAAITAYSLAISAHPGVGYPGLVYAERGDTFEILGHHDRAIADYDAAIAMKADPVYVSRRSDAILRRSTEQRTISTGNRDEASPSQGQGT